MALEKISRERGDRIFNSIFNGQKNIFTPVILDYYTNGSNLIIELSTDYEKIMGIKMFGVTVLNNLQRDFDLSQGFTNQSDAMNYIQELCSEDN